LLAAGTVRVVIDRAFALFETRQAHQRAARRHIYGGWPT